jgi:hypothetical protein
MYRSMAGHLLKSSGQGRTGTIRLFYSYRRRGATLLLRDGKEPGSHLHPQAGHYNSGIFMGFLSHLCKIPGYR